MTTDEVHVVSDAKSQQPPADSVEEIDIHRKDQEQEETVDGRERLKRHQNEVAGRVRVPDMWGQEGFLKDWVDCTNQFDKSVAASKIMSARAALLEEGRRRANMNMNMKSPGGLRIDGRCCFLL